MSKEVVETIYGKHTKFEIVKDSGVIANTKYYVRMSTGKVSGTFSSLSDAVQWAREQAQRE